MVMVEKRGVGGEEDEMYELWEKSGYCWSWKMAWIGYTC